MRLIDADALRKAFYKDRVSVCSHVFSLVNPLDSEDLAFEIYNMIDDAPTVDAVPVSYIYKRAMELKNDDMIYAYTVLNSLIANYRADGKRKESER